MRHEADSMSLRAARCWEHPTYSSICELSGCLSRGVPMLVGRRRFSPSKHRVRRWNLRSKHAVLGRRVLR